MGRVEVLRSGMYTSTELLLDMCPSEPKKHHQDCSRRVFACSMVNGRNLYVALTYLHMNFRGCATSPNINSESKYVTEHVKFHQAFPMFVLEAKMFG